MKIRTYFIAIVFSVFFHQIILVSAADAANKIMPLGDSITQGTSSGVDLEEFQVSYRKALYDKLKAAGYVINDEIFVGTLFSGESEADFDPDHEGQPGWRTDQIVDGHIGLPAQGKLDEWLIAEEPNIVLLHIGTNDIGWNNEDWNEVEAILEVIDDYETASGKAVWVIQSLITDRSCDPYLPPCPNSLETTNFNNDVRDFVFFPRQAGGDKIILVDMQNGAGIDYDRWYMGGDMWNTLHPFETGYVKMADIWFTGLMDILPQASADPDQNVNEFEPVILDASGSSDPKNGALTYQWTQTAGTAVVLSDAQAVQPTFDAPDAGPFGTTLTFTLTVTDEDELVSTDTVNIIVEKISQDEVLAYTPVSPCRVVDTRKAGGAISAGGIRSYDVRGAVASQGGNSAGCSSPKGEPLAVDVNVTSVPLGNGWISAYPFGSTAPTASLVNYRSDAQNVANSGTVKTCFNCARDINIKSGGGATHVIIDVLGYYYSKP